MSYLSGVVTGNSTAGVRGVIGGPEKVGKTTLACDAPNSLLLPMEVGTGVIQTARLPNMITTWEDVRGISLELIARSQQGRLARGSSLVWDSGTALERIIFDYTVRSDPKWRTDKSLTMATAHGAYGKAYAVARNLFNEWRDWQDQLCLYGGINIIVTCHVFSSRVSDPTVGEFNTWDLQLFSPKNDKEYGIREYMTQWADFIGFYHEPLYLLEKVEGDKMARAVSSNVGRVLGLERTPSYVAGNRYGVHNVVPIPDPMKHPPGTAWNQLANAIYEATGKRIDIFNRAGG